MWLLLMFIQFNLLLASYHKALPVRLLQIDMFYSKAIDLIIHLHHRINHNCQKDKCEIHAGPAVHRPCDFVTANFEDTPCGI